VTLPAGVSDVQPRVQAAHAPVPSTKQMMVRPDQQATPSPVGLSCRWSTLSSGTSTQANGGFCHRENSPPMKAWKCPSMIRYWTVLQSERSQHDSSVFGCFRLRNQGASDASPSAGGAAPSGAWSLQIRPTVAIAQTTWLGTRNRLIQA
jgi:hypothetical protein